MAERTGRMSAVMDELVSGAHSARDGVFNTLDAVGRRTRAANAALVERVRGLRAGANAERSDPAAAPAERDTRFDPEDEWELLPAGADPARTRTEPPRPDEDDDDEFSQTWLR